MRSFAILLLFCSAFFGCSKKATEEKRLIVADHKVSCMGVAPQECLLIKEQATDDWQFFYDNIEGFSYEAGFEYIIEVEIFKVKNPPADASDRRYVLKRIISKQ